MEEIAQALGISHGSISTILHDRLGMRKLTARLVPKSLSDEFVCVEVLRPSQPNGVMSSGVSLPNHTFTGQA